MEKYCRYLRSYTSGKNHLSKKTLFTINKQNINLFNSESKHDSEFWMGSWFCLKLQSINLLVCVTCLPQRVKKTNILGVEKWSVNSLRHNTIADFLKKSLVEENKTQKLKKLTIFEGEHWLFFWEGSRLDGKRPGTHFC